MRSTKRTGRLLPLALAMSLVVAACGGGEDEGGAATAPADAGGAADDGDGQSDAAPELDEVGPVAIGSIGTPGIFAMLLAGVAEDAGFFDKYKVDAQVRPMETGVDAARAVQGGDLDMAFSPTGPVMGFTATGVDVAAVFGMDNIDWLVGSVNQDVTECEDLEGETIGVDSVGGARYSVLEIILDSCGLSIDDVEVVGFPGPSAIQAVAAGQIDTSVIHIDDLYLIEEQGDSPMHVVTYLRDVDPDQHYLVLWALDDTVESKREELVRVVAAMIDSVRYINDESARDEVVRIGAATTGHPEDIVRQALDDFLELEFWPVDRHGMPEEGIEATIEEQVRLDNIPEDEAPGYEDVVDTSVWEAAFDLVEQHNG